MCAHRWIHCTVQRSRLPKRRSRRSRARRCGELLERRPRTTSEASCNGSAIDFAFFFVLSFIPSLVVRITVSATLSLISHLSSKSRSERMFSRALELLVLEEQLLTCLGRESLHIYFKTSLGTCVERSLLRSFVERSRLTESPQYKPVVCAALTPTHRC